MRKRCFLFVLVVLFSRSGLYAQPKLSPEVQRYVRVQAAKVVLEHVRIIDGTGHPAVEDQNLVVEGGKILAIQPGADTANAKDTTVLDLRGYSVIPGIVGMHNHLFYVARPNQNSQWKSENPVLVPQMTFSAPRLYLSGGVTTMRTTGSVETYADLNLKAAIDAGHLIGPHIDVTGPYLEGATGFFLQMYKLRGPDDARQLVDYWADRGVTSFKAYMNISRDELKAAVDAAHKRNLKVTGHLCSVTYKEAAELGIDDLEHGFFVNTQLDPGKKPDLCSQSVGGETLARMEPDGPEAKDLIATLIRHHVAITSTLPVFEGDAGGGRPPVRQQVLDAMTPEAREAFFYMRQRPAPRPKTDEKTEEKNEEKTDQKTDQAMLFKRDMELERAFVAAGGLLIAGPDPTGAGDVVPGFGDQREIELLVEAGFTPVEAIKIATLNGASYMGKEKQIGSLAV